MVLRNLEVCSRAVPLRSLIFPAAFLVGLAFAAAGCAADSTSAAPPGGRGGSGGVPAVTGGTPSANGGFVATGGSAPASGGAPAAGGVPGATGGVPGASGGTPAAGGVAAGAGAGGLASGGVGGGAPGTPPPPLSACAKAIFTTCSASCHSTVGVPFPTLGGGLDLSGDNVAMRLADIPAKNSMATDTAGCGALINTTVNSESVLIKRIKGEGPCGPLMPLGVPLTATEQQCLEEWVNSF